jgi:hypothetical protein
MPLIDLKTNLKSLKYGNDRTNAGSSGQPYVITDPDGNTNLSLGANNVAGDVLRLIGVNKVPLVPNLSVKLNDSKVGRFVNQALNTDDFIRGGAVGSVQASINDIFRIGAFLTDVPKGSIFIAKQVGLQLSNPKLEVKKGGAAFFGGILKAAFSGSPAQALGTATGGILGPTRIYNAGINTLAQVPANAFGIHFSRHGLLPVQDEQTKYENVVTFNNESTNSKNNRLIELKDKFDLGDQVYEANPNFNLNAARKANRQANRNNKKQFNFQAARQLNRSNRSQIRSLNNNPLNSQSGAGKISYVPTKFKKQKLDLSKQTIASYPTGPGSVYGIGTTIIRRYSFSEDKLKIEESLDNAFNFAGKSRTNGSAILYSNALGEKAKLSINTAAKAISEYSIEIPNSFTGASTLGGISPGSVFIQAALRQGTFETYAKLANAVNTTTTSSQAIPAFGTYTSINNVTYGSSISNTAPLLLRGTPDFKYYGTGSIVPNTSGSAKTYNNSTVLTRNDAGIMSVIFRAINPFDASSSTNEKSWAFNAYMSGYKDDFNATWNDINYAGRAESFYIYNKFKRSISFNLKIPCFNKIELYQKHRELGQLASVTAGSYKNGLLLGGVLIKINMGNYLVGEYATLNNVSYSIPDDASWDIADDALLSMYLDVSFNLTIVHKDLPRYQQAEGTSGFFGHLPSQLTPAYTASVITPILTKFKIN